MPEYTLGEKPNTPGVRVIDAMMKVAKTHPDMSPNIKITLCVDEMIGNDLCGGIQTKNISGPLELLQILLAHTEAVAPEAGAHVQVINTSQN